MGGFQHWCGEGSHPSIERKGMILPWDDNKGEIQTAECGCPAGVVQLVLAQRQSCKYVCALCYTLEEFCCIKDCIYHGHAHLSCKNGISQESEYLKYALLMT